MPSRQNDIRIETDCITVRNPSPHEIARIRGLFKRLFHCYPAITVTGIWPGADVLRAGNPVAVTFIGVGRVEVEFDGATVALRLDDGRAVRVTFKMPRG